MRYPLYNTTRGASAPWRHLMSTRREFLTQAAVATFIAGTAATPAAAAEAKPAPGAPAGSAKPAGALKTYTVPHTDLVVSRLAYGNAMLGTDWNSPDFISQSVAVMHAAHGQGITFFDTADVYGHGKSELALGQVLKDTPGLRRRIVIQSKCSIREGGVIDSSRDHITSAVQGSLKRLGTDRLDILLLHWPDSLMQPEEVARAFDELHAAGKVRYFGVSNFSPYQIELLRKYVRQPLVANQIQLGLAHWYTDPGASKAARSTSFNARNPTSSRAAISLPARTTRAPARRSSASTIGRTMRSTVA